MHVDLDLDVWGGMHVDLDLDAYGGHACESRSGCVLGLSSPSPPPTNTELGSPPRLTPNCTLHAGTPLTAISCAAASSTALAAA